MIVDLVLRGITTVIVGLFALLPDFVIPEAVVNGFGSFLDAMFAAVRAVPFLPYDSIVASFTAIGLAFPIVLGIRATMWAIGMVRGGS